MSDAQRTNGRLVAQSGRLYAIGGFFPGGAYPVHLFTSVSADAGQTWTLLDDFQLAAGFETEGLSLMERSGSLYSAAPSTRWGSALW